MHVLSKFWLYVAIITLQTNHASTIVSELNDSASANKPSRSIASTESHSSFSSLMRLPPEIIPCITQYLDARSIGSLKATSQGMLRVLSSNEIMRGQRFRVVGFFITIDGVNPTEDGAIILDASPTLSVLWKNDKYFEVLEKKSQILGEVRKAAAIEVDIGRREIFLRQLVMLGQLSEIKSWKEALLLLKPAQIIKTLFYVFTNMGSGVSCVKIDDLIVQIVTTVSEISHILFHTKEGVGYLKQLCSWGAFEVLSLVAYKIQQGLDGFQSDIALATKITGILESGTLKSTWRVVRHKKHAQPKKYNHYERITLQDLLPKIMSAIDARKDHEGTYD